MMTTKVGRGAADWRSRVIYQVLTDRFARTDGSTTPCNDIRTYCGGTFQGMINRLDYIADMGFDAIWISPIVTNSPGGFHGYWALDLTTVNSNFGTADDLKNLVQAAHARGIFVMVDVVVNHMGNAPNDNDDFSVFTPFNDSSHFHTKCQITNFNNQPQVEVCRLANLPDLNQSNPYVDNTLNTYGFDGIRMDTTPEVPISYWQEYQGFLGDVYIVGEVYDGRVNYVANYQNALEAVLSYPMFWTLGDVYGRQRSMYEIQSQLQSYASQFKDVSLLGAFLDNHDQARFLSYQGDYVLYKAALTYLLFAESIPIVYYGTEQGFKGSGDPYNREALWTSNYDSTAPLYQYIKQVIGFRRATAPWKSPQVQRYADDSFYAFTRGTTFVATTNAGSNGAPVSRSITYHPYKDGTKLCNMFYPATDCLIVQGGQFQVTLLKGEAKVYVPQGSVLATQRA